MKIGNVRYRNKNYLARQVKDEILLYSSIPSKSTGVINPESTDYLISSSQAIKAIATGEISPETAVTKEADLEFLPCILHPEKIVGVGFNYRQHLDETRTESQGNPVLFSKYSDAVAGHRQRVKIPDNVHKLDYEAELAIVVGKRAFQVKQDDALNYIFGYCPANDISARDLQMLTSQFLIGKTLPGFCPIGPFITTHDEIPDPGHLDISLKLNGESRQKSNTSNMIYSCEYLLSYITKFFPLNPGDIILTGTPGGVILGYPPEKQVWIRKGDVAEVSIEKLGSLVTVFS